MSQPSHSSQPAQPDRHRPITIDEKLNDILKRLGRIEKHLIDIRDNVETDPGKPRYVIERGPF